VVRERWGFRSTTAEPRAGEAEEFARRLGEAFRVATGLGGVVRWTWRTGPSSTVAIDGDGPEARQWIQRVLLSAYPSGQWSSTLDPPGVDPPGAVYFAVAVPDGLGPFRAVSEEPRSWVEPVLGLLGTLPDGVQLCWELRPLRSSPSVRVAPPPAELVPQPPGFRAGAPSLPRRSISDRMEERRLGPHWAVSATLTATAGRAGPSDAARLIRLVEAASRREGGSGFGFRRRLWPWRSSPPLVIVSSGEAAALFPTPWTRSVGSESIIPTSARRLVVGRDAQGLPFVLWMEPNHGRHLLVLGETGMGKSSLMIRLGRQVAADHGLILFDPIGDTARNLMASLPSSALGRLLWVSPTRSPVGINALASIAPAPDAPALRSERALGDLVTALKRVRAIRYGDELFWGPRINETLTKALTAAAAIPGGTIVDAERLLSEPGRRPHGIPPVAQDAVENLRLMAREHPEAVDGTRRVLSEVTRSTVLTRMLGQRQPRSAVSDWVRPGRITIVSGDAVEVGETTARYLLSTLLALTWAELLTRADASKTILMLDEAQWYAHESVTEALRIGRLRNVHLWMATQALASLPDVVREAAQTNSADWVLYRGSPEEAHEFHRWAPSVREETLLSLPRGRAVVLRGKNESAGWVAIDPPGARRSVDDALRAAVESSRPYWVPEDEVDDPGTDAPPSGRGPGPEGSGDAAPVEVRSILLLLWAAMLDADPAPTIELRPAVLRAAFDPGGTVLRRVGSELARVGALVENRREADGRVWVVERAGLARLLGPGVGAEELAAATSAWRGVAGRAR
jgi:hypothetical protein